MINNKNKYELNSHTKMYCFKFTDFSPSKKHRNIIVRSSVNSTKYYC